MKEILLRCWEFDSASNLRSVFTTQELSALKNDIPEENSRGKRVESFIKWMATQSEEARFSFLRSLAWRYDVRDGLRGELDGLTPEDFKNAS